MKIIFATFLFSIIFSSYSGTESGGGGGVVWVDSKPLLLDLFTIIEDPSHLPNPPLNSEDISDITESEAYKQALLIFEKWDLLDFYGMPSLIKFSSKRLISWNLVDRELVSPPHYVSTSIPKDSVIETAAYFSLKQNKDVEVQVNRKIWQQMNLLGRTGLIIHESLRKLQIGLQYGFDDEALQRATAIYLLCHPTRRLNYYMFYVLSNSPSSADRIYGDFNNFISGECRRVI